jgi:HTH-type transcriptional regulator/antitoxin HigA
MAKIKPIETEDDYRVARERISLLMEQEDELKILAVLAQDWEAAHFPPGPPDPIEAIKFRMEQQGLKQADLVPYFGSRSKVSEVLSGKRPLSLAMIRRLHHGLGIPAKSLLREPTTAEAADGGEE